MRVDGDDDDEDDELRRRRRATTKTTRMGPPRATLKARTARRRCEEAGTSGGRVPHPTRCHDGQALNREPRQRPHRPPGSPSPRRRPLLALWATGTTTATRRLGKSPAADTNTIGGPRRRRGDGGKDDQRATIVI